MNKEIEKVSLKEKTLQMYNDFISIINVDGLKDIMNFIFINNKFINNISSSDVETYNKGNYFECEKGFTLYANNKYIAVMVAYSEDIDDKNIYAKIGIDIKGCFDKLAKCPILLNFPISSKRELEKTINFLKKMFDVKSNVYKELNRYGGCYGSFYKNY